MPAVILKILRFSQNPLHAYVRTTEPLAFLLIMSTKELL